MGGVGGEDTIESAVVVLSLLSCFGGFVVLSFGGRNTKLEFRIMWLYGGICIYISVQLSHLSFVLHDGFREMW
jgi:hypothetical protein